jgi:glycolate oxidase FAD binding subunit
LGAPTQKTLADAEAEACLDRLAHFSAATGGGMPWKEEAGQTGLFLSARAFVPVSQTWALVQAAESLAAKAGLPFAFRISAARGALDLWLRQQPGSDPRLESVAAWATDLRNTAVAFGGQLMVTGRPETLAASVDTWTNPGPALQLMRRLKERFDPQRTLNPGRFVGGL